MKNRNCKDKLRMMERRLPNLRSRKLVPGLLLLSAAVLLVGGCNLLRRGDLHRTTEETPFIKTLGFRVSDNAANPSLTSDIVHDVRNDDSLISITVPYALDTTLALNLFYETVGDGDGIIVGVYTGITPWDPDPADITPWDSGAVPFSFNVGSTPQTLNLMAYSPGSLGTDRQFREISVELRKDFYPALLNPYHPGVQNPMVLRIGFVDENGDPINAHTDPALGFWDAANSEVHYDGSLINIIDPPANTAPSYQTGMTSVSNASYTSLPAGYEVALNALTPDEHWVFLPAGVFSDEDGYSLFREPDCWMPGIRPRPGAPR